MIGSLLLWAFTAGIAYGDVTLLGVAAFVPALIAPHLAVSMILFSLVAALVVVGVRRLRSGEISRHPTIALAPPLLVGWLATVMAS